VKRNKLGYASRALRYHFTVA